MENFNLSRAVLVGSMQLNPVPNVSDTDFYLLYYIFFSIIAILAIIFILGTILTVKYGSHRRLMGRIFVALGIIEIVPYILSVIHTILVNLPYLLYNPWMFLFILGCVTLAGGVANIKQTKSHWMFFLIMAAIIVVLWTFDVFFVFRY